MSLPLLLPELIRQSSACFNSSEGVYSSLRARFVLNGLLNSALARQLLFPAAGSYQEKILNSRPEMKGILVWPYIRADWSPGQRIARLLEHYSKIETLRTEFQIDTETKLLLFDLSSQMKGLSVVLDQPTWFMREGSLALNLFVEDYRAFTVAFSLLPDRADRSCLYIGAVQGRNHESARDLYREITKSLYGVRPRDFLIECLRFLGGCWDAERILCVADEVRHHRHPYFAKPEFHLNYNEIWADRGGFRISPQEFEIPLKRQSRPLESIAARKRSQYRKRYEFFDELESQALSFFPFMRTIEVDAR